ncbi:hypothetical protein D3C81_1654410 [compost metagenome]
MHVAVQDHLILRGSQQGLGARQTEGKRAALLGRRQAQRGKPVRQRHQRRWRRRTWSMQPGQCRTEDAAGVIVLTAEGHVHQRLPAHGAFHQQPVAVMGVDPGGAIALPPGHQQIAEFLLGIHGDFQHGRHIVQAYR